MADCDIMEILEPITPVAVLARKLGYEIAMTITNETVMFSATWKGGPVVFDRGIAEAFERRAPRLRRVK